MKTVFVFGKWKVSRLHLYKMRVPEYYVKIKHYLRHKNKVNENKVITYWGATH